MKSLPGMCVAIGLFCVVPVGSPPLARGSDGPASATADLSAATRPQHPLWAYPDTREQQGVPTPSAFPPARSGPYLGAPPVTRLQILDLARSAVGTSYVHGGESWERQRAAPGGTDCSGLIAKAWQVPRAAESWEELSVRPTTETLSVSTEGWFKLPVSQRQPGDVLVRREALVHHALIYERDDAYFAENGSIWVYEAAEPRVKHRSYRLAELSAYTLSRRRGIDDVGLVGRSHNWIFGEMIDAFRQAGGQRSLGTPHDRGLGVLVHGIEATGDAGVIQDFHDGLLGPALLALSRHRPGAFFVAGAFLEAYRAQGGPMGWLGFPTSAARRRQSICPLASEQDFVSGSLLRDCAGQVRTENRQAALSSSVR
jgi:cell wall-associated NlpC family hydrolase